MASLSALPEIAAAGLLTAADGRLLGRTRGLSTDEGSHGHRHRVQCLRATVYWRSSEQRTCIVSKPTG